MKKIKFVNIDGRCYTTARYIEDMAEALGGYDVYTFDGTTAGPRHPGTVVAAAFRSIMKDPTIRRRYGITLQDACRIEFDIHSQNDKVRDYLLKQGMISVRDFDREHRHLNLFTKCGAEVIIAYLRKEPKVTLLKSEYVSELKRKFKGCTLTPLTIDKDSATINKKRGTLL